MSKSTANQYYSRIRTAYNENLDRLIAKLKQKSSDPYDVLTSYCIYLQNQNLSTSTLKYNIGIAKNFLEFNDVEISPRKFKLKVRLPKVVTKDKEALSKEDIVDILNTCSNIRLKTFVMFLASTGCRAGEATSIRLKDLNLHSNPSKAFLRGEFTKTKKDRSVFLTDEMVNQLETWIEFKYRKRRVCFVSKQTGKSVSEYRTPKRNEHDLIFASRTFTEINRRSIYSDLCHFFERTLDRMGKGQREDGNERRRQITLHSFRRFVKTTISDLGYQDFSEFIIGHSGSTYWRKKDSETSNPGIRIGNWVNSFWLYRRQSATVNLPSVWIWKAPANTYRWTEFLFLGDSRSHIRIRLLVFGYKLTQKRYWAKYKSNSECLTNEPVRNTVFSFFLKLVHCSTKKKFDNSDYGSTFLFH